MNIAKFQTRLLRFAGSRSRCNTPMRGSLSSVAGADLGRPKRPNGARMAWGPDVLSECIPFTAELITSKRRAFEQIAVSYVPPSKRVEYDEDTKDMGSGTVRRVDDSWLEITIPFYDHPELRDTFANSDNKTVRYGMLFQILDALAADISYRHCNNDFASYTIVTAAVDEVNAFVHIDVTQDLKLQGYLTYVGSSSMEV